MNMLAKLSTLANKASCRVKSYGEQYNASALFFDDGLKILRKIN